VQSTSELDRGSFQITRKVASKKTLQPQRVGEVQILQAAFSSDQAAGNSAAHGDR